MACLRWRFIGRERKLFASLLQAHHRLTQTSSKECGGKNYQGNKISGGVVQVNGIKCLATGLNIGLLCNHDCSCNGVYAESLSGMSILYECLEKAGNYWAMWWYNRCVCSRNNNILSNLMNSGYFYRNRPKANIFATLSK